MVAKVVRFCVVWQTTLSFARGTGIQTAPYLINATTKVVVTFVSVQSRLMQMD